MKRPYCYDLYQCKNRREQAQHRQRLHQNYESVEVVMFRQRIRLSDKYQQRSGKSDEDSCPSFVHTYSCMFAVILILYHVESKGQLFHVPIRFGIIIIHWRFSQHCHHTDASILVHLVIFHIVVQTVKFVERNIQQASPNGFDSTNRRVVRR